jgi:hypothetical protein
MRDAIITQARVWLFERLQPEYVFLICAAALAGARRVAINAATGSGSCRNPCLCVADVKQSRTNRRSELCRWLSCHSLFEGSVDFEPIRSTMERDPKKMEVQCGHKH